MKGLLMRKIGLVSILWCCSVCGLFGSENVTSQIELLKGEKWWGVFSSGGRTMPFTAPFERIDLSQGRSQTTPFLVSSRGRYIWSAEPFAVTFTGREFVIESPSEEVQAVAAGRTLREAYLVCCHKNFPPAGKVPDPWLLTAPVYDPSVEVAFEVSSQPLYDYVDRLLRAGYPAGTLIIPSGWQSSVGSYQPDNVRFGDFKQTVHELHAKGFRVMLTVTPFVSGDGAVFRKYRQDSFFIQRADSSVAMADWAGGYSAVYDLTRPEVFSLLRGALDRLREEYGVDGFLFDCSGMLPLLRYVRGGGRQYLARWSELSNGCDFCQYTTSRDGALSGYVRNLRLNMTFDWNFLRRAASDLVSANLLGYPYTVVGPRMETLGNVERVDEKVFLRYLQLVSVMPVMNITFAPWNITDPAVAASCKTIVNDRSRLGSYYEELVKESARTAEPILRHLEYEFPRNGFADCDDQFMLGSRYLIAPLLDGQNSRMVRFPRGIWADISGKRYRGPLVTQVTASNDHVLYFEAVK